MNFSAVKGVTIPEGNVKSIAINGQKVWSGKELTWDAVFASIDAGTYATDYAVGDCIPLDLGSEGVVNMQIAAFDADDLADGSGKAHISFISKELLTTLRRMNPALVTNDDGTYQEGTGAIGGWGSSEMRTYLKETIKPLIPEAVRDSIVSVNKTQTAYNTEGTSFSQTTEDDVWLPSRDEVIETTAKYYSLFKNVNANRIKYKAGSTSAKDWWVRSPFTISDFNVVTSAGGAGKYNGWSSEESYYIALGFCT